MTVETFGPWYFEDGNLGFLITETPGKRKMYETTNGGLTWRVAARSDLDQKVEAELQPPQIEENGQFSYQENSVSDSLHGTVSLTSTKLLECERVVLRLLADAWNESAALDWPHPADGPDFANAIHAAQNIVLTNVARRLLKDRKET